MSKAGEFQSSPDEQMKELTEELPLVTKLKKLSSSLTTVEVPNILHIQQQCFSMYNIISFK